MNINCITSSFISQDVTEPMKIVKALEVNGYEWLHIDLIDGVFSPDFPLGMNLVKQLKPKTKLKFDCHLMVNTPQFFIDQLLDIGVEQIIFHMETCDHIDGTIKYIQSRGCKAGVYLKPATPLCMLDELLPKVDVVGLMMINPGFAHIKGEKQDEFAEGKVWRLIEKINNLASKKPEIELDGRISVNNIKTFGNNVQYYVAGSTMIDKTDFENSIKKLKETVENI